MVAIGSTLVVESAGAFNIQGTTAMNVLDFGVKNTGISTDAVANNAGIQTAFAALAANGGVLVFPAGTYYVTGLSFIDKVVTLIGDGGTAQEYSSGDLVRTPTLIRSTTNAPIITFTSSSKVGTIVSEGSGIRDIGILGNGAGSAQIGIVVDNREVHLRNVQVAGCFENIQIADCVKGSFTDVDSYRPTSGNCWRIDTTLGTGAGRAVTATSFRNCTSLGAPGTSNGWLISGNVESLTWEGGFNESNGGWGMLFQTGPINNQGFGIHDESNTLGSVKFADTAVLDNLIILAHQTSPTWLDSGVRNYVWAPRNDLTGIAQRLYMSVGDILTKPITASDLDATRFRNRDNTDNGVIVERSNVSTFGIAVAPTDQTNTLAVPQGTDSYCVPNTRGITSRNTANNANVQMLAMSTVVNDAVTVDATQGAMLAKSGGKVGFYGTTPVIQDTGWTAATNTKTKTTFDTTTVTLPVLAAHVGAIIDILLANGLMHA